MAKAFAFWLLGYESEIIEQAQWAISDIRLRMCDVAPVHRPYQKNNGTCFLDAWGLLDDYLEIIRLLDDYLRYILGYSSIFDYTRVSECPTLRCTVPNKNNTPITK